MSYAVCTIPNLNPNPNPNAIRMAYDVYIIPMVNPDGVIHGNYRHNNPNPTHGSYKPNVMYGI